MARYPCLVAMALLAVCLLASQVSVVAGRKLLDPIAPKDPVMSDSDFFTKWQKAVSKVEQEKAKNPGRRLLDPIVPHDATVYDTSSHMFDVVDKWSAKVEQERAKESGQVSSQQASSSGP